MKTLPLLVGLLVAHLGACRAPAGPTWGHGREHAPASLLVLDNGAEPESIDPGLATGHPDGRIVSALFDGLTEYDPRTLEPVPSAAASWTPHPDGRGWTFHLRPDATWTDGTRVTAHDYAWSWERLLNPVNGSRYSQQLFGVVHARAYHQRLVYRLAGDAPPLAAGTPVEVTQAFAVRILADVEVQAEDQERPVGRLARNTLVAISDQKEGWVQVRYDPHCPDLADLPALLDCPAEVLSGWVPAERTRPEIPLLNERVTAEATPLFRDVDRKEEVDDLRRGEAVVVLETAGSMVRVLVTGRTTMGWMRQETLEDVRGPRMSFEVVPVAEVDWPEPVTDPSLLGFRAVDDQTLEVRLQGSATTFPQQVAHFSLRAVPRRTVSSWGPRWTRPEHLVSSGPFRLVGHRVRARYELERNEGWWGASTVKLDRVVALSVEDQHASANLYRAGRTDVLVSNGMPAEFIPTLRDRQDFHSSPALATSYVQVNTRHRPLDDPRVRLALALAIDRADVVEVLGGGEAPADHVVPPGLAGYPEVRGPGFDPERARALLEEAGYLVRPERVQGREEWVATGFLPLTFLYNSQARHRLVATVLQHAWQKNLGIKVEIRDLEWQSYLRAVQAGDFDLAREGWIADYLDPGSFLEVWETQGGNNPTGWSSPAYDALLEQARHEVDPAARLALLARAEALLNEDLPVIPLIWLRWSELRQPSVRGWYPNLLDQHPLRFVWHER